MMKPFKRKFFEQSEKDRKEEENRKKFVSDVYRTPQYQKLVQERDLLKQEQESLLRQLDRKNELINEIHPKAKMYEWVRQQDVVLIHSGDTFT